jgi:hypothetical protein
MRHPFKTTGPSPAAEPMTMLKLAMFKDQLFSMFAGITPKGILPVLLPLLLLATSARAENHLSILITSNLQGKFSLNLDNQGVTDPLLALGRDIIFERSKGADLYLDMGNAFYPGILSKYSSGSIMMDFLGYFSCDAVLVSSKDLQIGTQNLEFLGRGRNVRLLSANIVQADKPVFTPWFTVDRAGIRIAFLGVSSKKIRFDVAEKDLYGYRLVEEKEFLAPLVKEIRSRGIRHIILLSGQTLKDTAEILAAYPDIGMALCGGDNTGRFLAGKASRVDLADGRSIVMVDDGTDYYRLELDIGDTLKVQALEPRKTVPVPTENYSYQEFKNRLTLWKQKFLEDENRLVASLGGTEFGVDDLRFAQLLRDRFDCELGVVEERTINPLPLKGAVKHSDLLSMVNRDYDIFLISLTGDELGAVQSQKEGLVMAGMDANNGLHIQGAPVVGTRPYHVAATQPAVQKIQRLLGKPIPYSNTWMTVTDLLTDDLQTGRIILRKDFDYLDRRFRTTIDAKLSNFIDNSSVRKGEDIETPPGQPEQSYNKWGLENTIDIAVYNKYHRFVFTPYMLYSRQDNYYLNNILRATLLYDYNLSETIKPYNKLRYDTVVVAVDGLRPSVLRETLGVSTEYKYISGKLGLGFEKEVRDPSKPALYGVELIMGVHFPFLSHFTYAFDLDTFNGISGEQGGQRQTRAEIDNAITADINSHLSLSFRHKFFYFSDDISGQSYQNSQFITSLDLKNDWKFW